jgi:hypothetical protein
MHGWGLPVIIIKDHAAIGGLLRLRFGFRGDRFWPEGDFGRFVSGPRNPVSPMQIDLE